MASIEAYGHGYVAIDILLLVSLLDGEDHKDFQLPWILNWMTVVMINSQLSLCGHTIVVDTATNCCAHAHAG
jgi:hypothetical protein